MDNIDGIISDSVFIIDSNNFYNYKSSLYGFALKDNLIYTNCEIKNIDITSNLPGAYIAVINSKTELKIKQDAFSTFYIFLYKDNDYFCLSNSFYKLCSYLKKLKHRITFNRGYSYQLISYPMAPLSLCNTLANEISIVPISSEIIINKNTSKVQINKSKIDFESVDIDSLFGIEIFKNWLSRWCGIFNSINKAGFPIQIDLTGGYDSRTIFSLACGGNINLNSDNIFVYSKMPKSKGGINHYKNDFSIASEISNILNFNLNKNSNIFKKKKISGRYAFEISKTAFLGFHKEGYLESNIYCEPVFHFGGFNGEPVRGKVRSLETWFNMIKNPCFDVHPLVYKELLSDYENLKNECSSEIECLTKFYLSTWGRNHYGQTIFRDFLIGKFTLSPFSDIDLFKLKFPSGIDKDVIFALIIKCTCPSLFEIPFNNSKFSIETKKYVNYLLNKYDIRISVNDNYFNFSNLKGKFSFIDDGQKFSGDEYLYSIFSDINNKKLFLDKFGIFGDKLYDYSNRFFKNKDLFFYNQWVYVVVSIIEFFKIIYDDECKQISSYLLRMSENYPYLTKLVDLISYKNLSMVARLDIKNFGSDKNKIEILECSDKNISIDEPSWFVDKYGVGKVLHSAEKKINLKIKCVGSGVLSIILRSRDIRDKNNERVSIFVRYAKFHFNKSPVFDSIHEISHDFPFSFKENVFNGEVVELFVEWV